jgi:signal transduction histidine kinase
MLESIDGLIYVVDMDTYEILFANEYVRRLFGFDPVGRSCFQFIHSNQDGPCTFCTNSRLLDGDGNPADPIHWEYRNPFNKKWYSAKAQAIMWSHGKYVRLEIAVDITEQKRLQRFLQEARKQAKLAIGARSRFVAMVAHDMKSPFFSITQMLRRILERATFDHQVHREFLENIVENGHRMLQMIDNLLSMDRFETGDAKIERVFFDVSVMIDEVLQNFRHPAFEKGIKLLNNVPENTILYADKYLYFMVLNNLVSNAVKFSERGCSIDVFMPDESKKMTIAVKDNGRGMSEGYVENLFKADVKTSNQGTGGEKGSGLGLIFCSDIIKAHYGSISVDSKRGQGTVIIIELPECSNMDLRQSEK